MLSVISITSHYAHQLLIKEAVLENPGLQLKGQFVTPIDVLDIAPEIKPDIIILSSSMYFVGIPEFIRILISRNVKSSYILLYSPNHLDMIHNAHINYSIAEGMLSKADISKALEHTIQCIYARIGDYEKHMGKKKLEDFSSRSDAYTRFISNHFEGNENLFRLRSGILLLGRRADMLKSDALFQIDAIQNPLLTNEGRDYIEGLIGIYGSGDIFALNNSEMCIWIDLRTNTKSDADYICANIQQHYLKNMGIRLFFQHGSSKIPIDSLPYEYRELDKMFRYHFFFSDSIVLTQNFLDENRKSMDFDKLDYNISLLDTYITEGNRVLFKNVIHEIFFSISNTYSFQTYNYVCSKLLLWQSEKLKNTKNADVAKYFDFPYQTAENIFKAEDFMQGILLRLYDSLASESVAEHNNIVKKAIEFLNEHYTESVTLTELSAELHVHPSYLSKLFHMETGFTIVLYKNTLKIEHAKKMLENGSGISEAAYSTGFECTKYFSRIFKQITGKSPSEYRSEYRKEN